MEQKEVWAIIVDHSDLIGAVVYKTLARYSVAASKPDREDYKSRATEALASGRLAKWKPGSKSLKGWISMIVQQATIQELRKRRKTVRINTDDEGGAAPQGEITLQSPVDDPYTAMAKQEQHRRLMRARERLSNADRELFDAIVHEKTWELGWEEDLSPREYQQRRQRLIRRVRRLLAG